MPFPAEKCPFLQKMPFPAEKCTFLQKNAVFGAHMAENRRKSQEGFRAREARALDNFQKNEFENILEHPNLLELRSLDSSCLFFLSDTSLRRQ